MVIIPSSSVPAVFAILLNDRTSGVYNPQSLVSGQVVLSLQSPIYFKNFSLNFWGVEQTAPPSSVIRAKTLFTFSMSLVDDTQESLPSGISQFPFTVQFPWNSSYFAPSHSFEHGFSQYKLMAVIEQIDGNHYKSNLVPLKFDPKHIHPGSLLGKINRIKVKRNLDILQLIPQGHVMVDFQASAAAMVGKYAKIMLKIKKSSSKSVQFDHLTIKLCRKFKMATISEANHDNEIDYYDKLDRVVIKDLKPNTDSLEYNLKFPIPSNAIPSFHGSSVEITYVFRLNVHFKGLQSTQTFEKEILIGNRFFNYFD